ncbi:MAG TPA: SDR family oxidoreductase [Cellvibrio sp.]|nr:SDR family oxidoreductase [Cellvibrio sp.]
MPSPVLVITGASRGIGAATALLAARQGYDICFTYHQQKDIAFTLQQQLEALGVKVIAVRADVGVEADVLNLFARVDREFGRVDALVNNAGILRQKLFGEIEFAELEKLFAVNVFGSFICAREAIQRMAKSRGGKGGAIVNVSSMASRFGSPFEYIDYAASKGAIDSFTIGLAKEMADEGIRVNAVRPGITATDIHVPGRVERIAPRVPMKRAGTVEEIAKSILWLLSDEASYVTGSILDVSGGI